MAATKGIIDQATTGKIKQHNKIVKEKRVQEALALREKLLKWREEKAKKIMLEKKISTTKGPQQKRWGKTSSQPLKTQLDRKSLQSNTGPGLQKALPSGKVVKRRTTMTIVPAPKAAPQAKGPAPKAENLHPAKRSRQSLVQSQDTASVISSKPPASRRSVGPRRGLGRIQKILQTDETGKRIAENSGDQKEGKENCETDDMNNRAKSEEKGEVMEPGTKTRDTTANDSKFPAPVLSTPLSHNHQFSVRQIIASLASKSAGASRAVDAQPIAGLHTTPMVAVHSIPGVGELDSLQHSQDPIAPGQTLEGETLRVTDATFSVNATEINNACDEATSTKPKRESLSAQFRKQKRESAAPTVRSQSHTSVTRKSAGGKSAPTDARRQSKQPNRSILKHKSCFPGETDFDVGVSFLPSVRKSTSNQDQTVEGGTKLASDQAKNGEEEKQVGHVTFAIGVRQEGDGANFRKTPAVSSRDRKTQESVRAKLNEWRASKVHTPNMRHAGCFHTDCHSAGLPTPRSQVKPSITVEQLSKQENMLVQEELKKNLLTHFNPAPSSRPPSGLSTVTVRQTPKTPKHQNPVSHVESGEQDLSPHETDIGRDENASSQVRDQEMSEEGMEMGEKGVATVPEFDMESWDISHLDQDFEKCLAAIESGSLSAGSALGWLDSIHKAFSDVKAYLGWYRCSVAAHKALGDVDAVLTDFERAIVNNVQPAEEVAKLLTETIKEMLTCNNKSKKGWKSVASASRSAGSATRKRRSSQHVAQQEIQKENMFESTTVKYSVVEVTPFKKRRRATEAGDKIVPVITPVRRSARISMALARTGSASEGRPRATEYTALKDVPSAEKEKMLFQPNKALDVLLSDDSPEQVF